MEAQHGLTCECGQIFQNPEELTKHVNLQGLEIQSDYELRQPDQDELEDIAEWYVNRFGLDYSEVVGTVNQNYFVVIDGYTSRCPGFAGKVLIEIGSAGPSFYTVYTWSDDQLQRLKQATEVKESIGEE